MANKKPRQLWLRVVVRSIPQRGLDPATVLRRLLYSVEVGQYRLPQGWQVEIHWRNSEHAEMKSGPWGVVLRESAQASSGFDDRIISYLRRRLRDLEMLRQREITARVTAINEEYDEYAERQRAAYLARGDTRGWERARQAIEAERRTAIRQAGGTT